MDGNSIKLCGQNSDNSIDFHQKALAGIYIITLSSIFIFIGEKLFKSLQMFPIKEKSGKLIMMFFTFNYLFLVSYPLLLIINLEFHTHDNQYQPISGVLRFLFNIYVVIHLMRAIRINYAHNVELQMKGILYKIIKNENICCLLTIILGIIIFCTPQSMLEYKENIFDYKDPRIQKLFVSVIDQLLLMLALFIIRGAQTTFKIRTELVYTILLENVIISTKQIFLLFPGGNQSCYQSFPYYYAIDSIRVSLQIMITVVIPLLQVKKVPLHFPYAIIADNFELFMSEPICIDIFHKFLIYYDKKHHQTNQKNKFILTLLNSPLLDKIQDEIIDSYPSAQNNQNRLCQVIEFGSLIYDERSIKKTKSLSFRYNNSEIESIRNQNDTNQQDQRLQTVECYIVWMDLTLIFANHNALDQFQPSNQVQQLENDITNYMINLLNNVDLQTMMPNKLAKEIERRFDQCKQSVQDKDQYTVHQINSITSASSDRKSPYSLKITYSHRGSRSSQKGVSKGSNKVEEEYDYEENEQHVGVLQLAYEIRYLMFEIISKIFLDDFKRTKSYDTIRERFSLNEKIQFRLLSLNLTKEFD